MSADAGKLSPIVDDEPLLSNVWKGKIDPTQLTKTTSYFGSGSTDGGGNPPPPPPPPGGNRPSLSDIVRPIKFVVYSDASGLSRAKAIIRIYNSSGEDLEKFAVLLTLSDKQGGSQ